MAQEVKRKKNWAVYILVLLAVIAGILAFLDAGRYMGWIPVNATVPGLGEISFIYPTAHWFAAGLSAFVGAIWFLVAYWLWTLNLSGWMFAIIMAVLNLIFLTLAILGQTTFAQVMPAVLVNGLALLLALLPGTKAAFAPPPPSVDASQGKAAKAATAAAASDAATRTRQAPAADAAADADADTEVDAEAVVVEADAPVVDAGAVPTAAGSQKLTVIEGIGPKIATALDAAGISNVAELSQVSVDNLRGILKDHGLSADPATWPKQAALAAAGDSDVLKAYQDKLEGGREV